MTQRKISTGDTVINDNGIDIAKVYTSVYKLNCELFEHSKDLLNELKRLAVICELSGKKGTENARYLIKHIGHGSTSVEEFKNGLFRVRGDL